MLLKRHLAFAPITLLLSAIVADASVPPQPKTPPMDKWDRDILRNTTFADFLAGTGDSKVKVCDNLYQHTCGAWVATRDQKKSPFGPDTHPLDFKVRKGVNVDIAEMISQANSPLLKKVKAYQDQCKSYTGDWQVKAFVEEIKANLNEIFVYGSGKLKDAVEHSIVMAMKDGVQLYYESAVDSGMKNSLVRSLYIMPFNLGIVPNSFDDTPFQAGAAGIMAAKAYKTLIRQVNTVLGLGFNEEDVENIFLLESWISKCKAASAAIQDSYMYEGDVAGLSKNPTLFDVASIVKTLGIRGGMSSTSAGFPVYLNCVNGDLKGMKKAYEEFNKAAKLVDKNAVSVVVPNLGNPGKLFASDATGLRIHRQFVLWSYAIQNSPVLYLRDPLDNDKKGDLLTRLRNEYFSVIGQSVTRSNRGEYCAGRVKYYFEAKLMPLWQQRYLSVLNDTTLKANVDKNLKSMYDGLKTAVITLAKSMKIAPSLKNLLEAKAKNLTLLSSFNVYTFVQDFDIGYSFAETTLRSVRQDNQYQLLHLVKSSMLDKEKPSITDGGVSPFTQIPVSMLQRPYGEIACIGEQCEACHKKPANYLILFQMAYHIAIQTFDGYMSLPYNVDGTSRDMKDTVPLMKDQDAAATRIFVAQNCTAYAQYGPKPLISLSSMLDEDNFSRRRVVPNMYALNILKAYLNPKNATEARVIAKALTLNFCSRLGVETLKSIMTNDQTAPNDLIINTAFRQSDLFQSACPSEPERANFELCLEKRPRPPNPDPSFIVL